MNNLTTRYTIVVLSFAIGLLFMLLYGNRSAITMTIFGSMLFIFVFNSFLYLKKRSLITHSELLMLITLYLLFGLSRLGSLNVPTTFVYTNAKESATSVILARPSAIDKICYYVGIDYNSFSIEAKNHHTWKQIYSYTKNYPFSFKWVCAKVNVNTTDKLLIRPVEHERLLWSTDNDLMLGELKLFYKGEQIQFTSPKSALFDEQTLPIDTSYLAGAFFDEIYFARTAYELIHDLPIYENTHPYLGKHLIGIGIKLFGMTPFGWRFFGTLFAAFIIVVFYYLAFRIFQNSLFALGAAILMTFGFTHFTQARLALVDTFGVGFLLLSFYYLYRFMEEQKTKLIVISGLFFGLAVSIKWSAAFAAVGYLFIAAYLLLSNYPLESRFRSWRLIAYGIFAYGVIAGLVYLLGFFDIFLHGGGLHRVIAYNLNMYHYHSTLVASHPYASPWWSWPLDLKPIGYYKSDDQGMTSTINLFGNPAIFWMGIVGMFYVAVDFFKKRSIQAAFILFGFLGLYMPYIFIDRLMFIYHFYYALPFYMLSILYLFNALHKRFRFGHYLFAGYLMVVITLFFLFYPVLSGYPIDSTYVQKWLIWLPNWWF